MGCLGLSLLHGSGSLVLLAGFGGLLGLARGLRLLPPVVSQVDGLELVVLLHLRLAEPNQLGVFDEELGHEEVEGAAVSVAGVVQHVEVHDFGELEDADGHVDVLDSVVAQVEVLKFGQLGQLLFDVGDLVSAQVQTLQGRKAALPAVELGDQVICQVELFQLRHCFEVGQVLELVVGA